MFSRFSFRGVSGWWFWFVGTSLTEDKEMPDILRAKVLLSVSRPVRVYEYEIEGENQAIFCLKAYVFAEQAQPPHPMRDLVTLRTELEPL